MLYNCPCSNTAANWTYEISSFIGNDYFCDTVNRGPGYNYTAFYLNNSLWDGEGCGSTCSCCEFNSLPWFCKSLPQLTTDDLVLRFIKHSREQNYIIIRRFCSIIDTIIMCDIILSELFSSKTFNEY